MTPPQYRAQCRKIRQLLASRERPKAMEIAAKLLKSFRDYRFHLGDLSTGRITLETRVMVNETLKEAGYTMLQITHINPAERALLDERARLHTTGKS
jgi:hypothetical protein